MKENNYSLKKSANHQIIQGRSATQSNLTHPATYDGIAKFQLWRSKVDLGWSSRSSTRSGHSQRNCGTAE